MKKKQTSILSLFISLLIVTAFTVCGTGPRGVVEEASAFIDFSGINSIVRFMSHQPPADSEHTHGPFTLENGITGDGLRISHRGDGNEIAVVQTGGEMAVQSPDYLYFFIDNETIMRAKVVTLEFTFFDDLAGNFNFQYVKKDNNFFPVTISKGGTNSFVTVKLQLDDCNFMGSRQNQGAQFRFESGTIIQKVKVSAGGMKNPVSDPPPPFAPATDLNNMIGKGITGYQVWFHAPGSWHHWSHNNGRKPGKGAYNVEFWPAGFEDYLANGAVLHDTDFTMPDGSVAQLFNSQDEAVIRAHKMWMRDAGIDGSAVQRFFETTSTVDTGTSPNHLTKIRDAAEEYGRIFYVMYDLSASGRHAQPDQKAAMRRIQLDWIYNIERKGVISSPNYAQAEGKPVVCLWGVHAIESTWNQRFLNVNDSIELIQWFRNRGYYVIGGLPDDVFWEQGGDRHPRGREMYALFDMISPWYVGRDVTGQILGGGQWMRRGINFCRDAKRSWADNKPIAFMPVIWPGFAWTNMPGNQGIPNATPRNAGQWVWTQVQRYLNRDSDNVIMSFYYAMFDEYDEATSWMKAGVDFFDVPLDQYFLTHSADGIWLSSDYYMRMARASTQALKAKIAAGGGSNTVGNKGYTGPLNAYNDELSIIVEHSEGPVFWRNSFERRNGRLKNESGQAVPVNHIQIDVGVPSGVLIDTPRNVTAGETFSVNRRALRGTRSDSYTPPSETLGMIYTNNAKSGGSAFRLEGQRTAGNGAAYLYKIADTRIKVNPGMSLSFWQRAENSLGANVVIDLLLENGDYLSDIAGYNLRNEGSPQNGWQKKTVNFHTAMEGHYITAVIAAYRDNGTATGNFAALIDDIIISRN